MVLTALITIILQLAADRLVWLLVNILTEVALRTVTMRVTSTAFGESLTNATLAVHALALARFVA